MEQNYEIYEENMHKNYYLGYTEVSLRSTPVDGFIYFGQSHRTKTTASHGTLRTPYYQEDFNKDHLQEYAVYSFFVQFPSNITDYNNVTLVVNVDMDVRPDVIGEEVVTYKDPSKTLYFEGKQYKGLGRHSFYERYPGIRKII